MTRKTAKQLHTKRYQSEPDYAQEYDALVEDFSIAEELIRARKYANLTQTELAKRMNTTQAQIARMEGGQLPSIRTLERLAAATGTKLHVKLIAA